MLPREEYANILNEADCFEAATKTGMGNINLRSDYKPAKYYVYALANPDTGKVFYVGKGIRVRWSVHEIQSRAFAHINAKVQITINDIERNGKRCLAICVKDGLTEQQAFSLEAYLISTVENLCNGAKGRATKAEQEFNMFKNWPRVTMRHLYMSDGRKTWLHQQVKDCLRIKREGLVKWGREVAAERSVA